MKKILVTGSSGLIGSAASEYFAARGFAVHGVDNNARREFFGPEGDVRWNQERLVRDLRNFTHHEMDVRNRQGILDVVKSVRPECVVHAAGQPSHAYAAEIPYENFDINTGGTVNLLEAARRFAPEASFIFLSSDKLYGDLPNTIRLKELEKRWAFDDDRFEHGISEDFPIDQSKHSLFGASKAAADIMVQEYGRYFRMPTCCLRCSCLTGPWHAGVEQHGFLSYLIRCNLEGREYRVLGYKGKQVRDNIHADDVAGLMFEIARSPRCAEVYNLGGGEDNACSILEAFDLVESVTGRKQVHAYVDRNRKGDHICYYSDLRKVRSHYPAWGVPRPLRGIVEEMVAVWRQRLAGGDARVGA